MKARKLVKDSDDLSGLQRDLKSIRSTAKAKSSSSISKAIEKLEVIVKKRESGEMVDRTNAVIAELKEKLASK